MRIIAGTARGRSIQAPAGRNTRPTLDRVRENLFNMLQTQIYGAAILDLFAGSGALSLEALSRGADHAVLVDRDLKAHACEVQNLKNLGFTARASVFLCEWETAVRRLREMNEKFDLVFLDPPYQMTDLSGVFNALQPLIQEDGFIVCEHQAGHPPVVPSAFSSFRERSWGYCGVTFYRQVKEVIDEQLCDSGIL